MSSSALSINGLVKSFDRPAVSDLSLTIDEGQFYALLGPNGAGKTTTLRMVAGLMQQDAGSIEIFGHDTLSDPLGAKAITAWVPDEPMIYDRLSPLENLEFVSGLWRVDPDYARSEAYRLLEWLQLMPHAQERCGGFSKGMKQKVALACALIHNPRLIILDEPLTGLDAGASRLVKDVLKERVKQGCTVVMTTHILEVAERMAERIGIIAKGQLVIEGSLEQLRSGRHHAITASLEDIFLSFVQENEKETNGKVLEGVA